MSCYDVAYDKDDGAAATGNWWDGLSKQQIFQLQEIKGNMSDVASSKDISTDGVDKEIQVAWEWPTDVAEPEWEIFAKMDNEDGTTAGPESVYPVASKAGNTINMIVVSFDRKKDPTGVKTLICVTLKLKWCTLQTLLTIDVKMKDSNGAEYWNTVTFLVAPCAMEMTITPGNSSAVAVSTLYLAQLCPLQGLDLLINPSHTQYLYKSSNLISRATTVTKTLNAWDNVFFGIESDFNYRGYGKVKHISSSSYCKVKRISANNKIPVIFEYKFEDLPQDKIQDEPLGSFDYNDVLFTVQLDKK